VSEPTGTDDPGQRPEEQVGSVSEEAVKLFGALSDWARDQTPGAAARGAGGGVGEGLAGLVDQAASALHGVDEHLATGSAECTYCPICRAVHLVRQTNPEVRAHLTSAASSRLQAAAGMLATTVPDDARPGARGPGVERIDLDTDDELTVPDGDDDVARHGARPGAWPEEDDE
jgi:hypothetical protein